MATFFTTPSRNKVKPRPKFSQISGRRGDSGNCQMISLWRTSGPAINWGKKVTNMQKSRKL